MQCNTIARSTNKKLVCTLDSTAADSPMRGYNSIKTDEWLCFFVPEVWHQIIWLSIYTLPLPQSDLHSVSVTWFGVTHRGEVVWTGLGLGRILLEEGACEPITQHAQVHLSFLSSVYSLLTPSLRGPVFPLYFVEWVIYFNLVDIPTCVYFHCKVVVHAKSLDVLNEFDEELVTLIVFKIMWLNLFCKCTFFPL